MVRAPSGPPVHLRLERQDFYKLLRAGWLPTSFVFGTCVYHVAHQGALQSLRQLGQNVEMPQYTQAVYDARGAGGQPPPDRGRALGGRRHRGRAALAHQPRVGREHAIEFLGVGTAVRTLGDTEPMPAPTLVLPLQ